jgi:FlaG/FlaF family flagellin (archaellin)
MSITRNRAGVYVDLQAKAKERVLPRTGRVLVPYQAEWGKPDFPVDMANYEERFAETAAQVDEIELAAENGATVIGYRMTDGNAAYAKFSVANSYEISALYPGTRGNDFQYSIRASVAEPSKKEIVVVDTKGIYETETYSWATVEEMIEKLNKSKMVRGKKLGDTAPADIADQKLNGGLTGTAALSTSDWTKFFNKVYGQNFDAVYVSSTDPAVQAAAKQWIADRRKNDRKLATLVIGGTDATDDDIEAHNTRSRAMNARFVVNCSISGRHINGKTYDSSKWAAWVAGLIAGTPANVSLTGVKVPLEEAKKDWGHSDILKGLAEGTLMATRDGYDYIIESAVNTLSTLGPGEREDFGKIRVSMTIDQVLNDIYTVGKKYKGKLDNDPDGRGIFIGAVLAYLAVRASQKAIAQGYTFTEDPLRESDFDFGFFKLYAKPLDAIEQFYIGWEVA